MEIFKQLAKVVDNFSKDERTFQVRQAKLAAQNPFHPAPKACEACGATKYGCGLCPQCWEIVSGCIRWRIAKR